MEKKLVQVEKLDAAVPAAKPAPKPEFGGRKGPEPVRYGDWENKGKCVDF